MIDYYRPYGQDHSSDIGLQYTFDTPIAAREQIEQEVDVVAQQALYTLENGSQLSVAPLYLPGGFFTNVYDLSLGTIQVHTNIAVTPDCQSVVDFLKAAPRAVAAVSGGFLYLADQGSGAPRQSALNLALQSQGKALSLPVVDREALIASADGRLSAQVVRARGEIEINQRVLAWSGSRTSTDADIKVYGNGNIIIRHSDNDEIGARKQRIRVLDESSRYTPPITSAFEVDLGLIADTDGYFRLAAKSTQGALDIFAHDVVLRCDERLLRSDGLDTIRLRSIDALKSDGSIQGAFSVGPLLNDGHFAANQINNDPSLGSDPPFADVPMVRLVLFQSDDKRLHCVLFDGRPESMTFRGVTPDEAAAYITKKYHVTWGCFLDPGRTAKIVTRSGENMMTYGNAHYLRWPEYSGEGYTWVPTSSRPIPSAVVFTV